MLSGRGEIGAHTPTRPMMSRPSAFNLRTRGTCRHGRRGSELTHTGRKMRHSAEAPGEHQAVLASGLGGEGAWQPDRQRLVRVRPGRLGQCRSSAVRARRRVTRGGEAKGEVDERGRRRNLPRRGPSQAGSRAAATDGAEEVGQTNHQNQRRIFEEADGDANQRRHAEPQHLLAARSAGRSANSRARAPDAASRCPAGTPASPPRRTSAIKALTTRVNAI